MPPLRFRRQRVWAGALLGLGALLGPTLVSRFSSVPWVVAQRDEIALKLALGGMLLLALALEAAWAKRHRIREAGFVVAFAGALGVAAWLDFGLVQGPGFVHHWDQYHYVLGAKYFPELSYDGLYVASLGAQADAFPDEPVHEYARDLRDYRVVPVDELFPHMREVWGRFEPGRWQSFMADNAHFVETVSPLQLGAMRLDHGYNATPAWTFVAQRILAGREIDHGVLVAMAALDLVLLASAFVLVFATFGVRAGCLSLVLLGFGYVGRFHWVGGAFLRHDWLFAVMLAACLLERRRPAGAGALLGYAAMVRVFPVLFLLGPVVLAVRAWWRREPLDWARRMAVGFLAAVLLCLAAGSATGRGPAAWPEFASAIRLHADKWLTNNVGLTLLFVYDQRILERRDVDWSAPEPWSEVQPRFAERKQQQRAWILSAQIAFLAMIGLAVWRMPLPEAALAGMAAVFALLTPSVYYWVMLTALPLARRTELALGALAVCLAMHAVHLLHPAFEMRYGALSLGLSALFLAWLAPPAIRNLREARRAPAALSVSP